MELICYFLVAEKSKTSGSQTFLNWTCHQACSNSQSTEKNWRKNVIVYKESYDFRKLEGQSQNLVLPLVRKANNNGNWDKHRTIKNNRTTHLQIVILFNFNIHNGKTSFFWLLLKSLKITSKLQLFSVALIKDYSLKAKVETKLAKDKQLERQKSKKIS